MLVLGFNGSFDLIDENRYTKEYWHDASAVLVEDGEVLFAIEEERLNRIKHTDKLPVQAIRACLESRGIGLADLDAIAFYWQDVETMRKEDFLDEPREPRRLLDPRRFLQDRFRRGLGVEVDASRFRFVHHHYAHAVSAFAFSGYESSLCITLDGEGDDCSGVVLQVTGNEYQHLATLSTTNSLGYFYLRVIGYLGYANFDEYKVMGLAPYGDPARYRALFRTFYTLLPSGDYRMLPRNILNLFDIVSPRRKGEPFTQVHKDIAAALQEALEEVAFHIVRHFQQATGAANLCLAGGVAHNCTLNGKLLRSGLFQNVFVQPAAHDAGCALGAALHSYLQAKPKARPSVQLEHVYWGTDIGTEERVRRELDQWEGLLEFRREPSIVERTAELLASDQVIGWVQGRSEFGPRALGNRSILADPRPAANKERINGLVKKREGYRPFAPSVLEEEAEEFFDVDVKGRREPHGFMIFVVGVKEEKREQLGAVTHVDGTARVQTVSRRSNERFWSLIRAFGRRTGVPVLLNTSFNNDVEPIVDSVEDAIVCFLTTGLDYLVIGDYLARKRDVSWDAYLSLGISLPPHVALHHVREPRAEGLADLFYLIANGDERTRTPVSSRLGRLLGLADGRRLAADALSEAGEGEDDRSVVTGLLELWSRRLVVLRPRASSAADCDRAVLSGARAES